MTLTGIKRRIGRILAEPGPKTYIASGGTEKELFSERKRSAPQLEKYRIIYDQGGIVTEAVNSYPMFITANGWRLEGEEKAEVDMVHDWLTKTKFDSILWAAVVDALVYGDAFQEIILNKDTTPAYIMPRAGKNFEILHDEHSKLAGYKQKVIINGKEKTANLKPKQIIHLQFWQASETMYGHGLIHRAYDEILRDTKTAEASAEAITRHGYKRYHVKVGLEGEIISKETLKEVDKEFQELETKNEFVTQHDLEILNLDDGGLEKVDAYNDITIMRLSSALGVPEEILGLRRGSTDATAVKRIETFYKKITAMQNHIAECFNAEIIDRITRKPNTVKLIFNDVDPKGEFDKAKWIAMIMKASGDPFAVLSKDWIKKQFGIIDQNEPIEEE